MNISGPIRSMMVNQMKGMGMEPQKEQAVRTAVVSDHIPFVEEMMQDFLASSGMKPSKELMDVLHQLVSRQHPADASFRSALKSILHTGEGTMDQKAQVLSVLSAKSLPVAPPVYEAVFRVLHGPSLESIIVDLEAEAPHLFQQPHANQGAPAERAGQQMIQPGRLQALHRLSEEFQAFKHQLLETLRRSELALAQPSAEARLHAGRLIARAAEWLERTINEKRFILAAGKEIESSLLRMAGELHRAGRLLNQGRAIEVHHILRGVRQAAEGLHGEPMTNRIGLPADPLSAFQKFGQEWLDETLTGRHTQEWMRSLGLNHEKEILEIFSRQAHGLKQGDAPEQLRENLKWLLLKGLEGEANPRGRHLMEQALSHITGQQLLSKPDAGQPIHQLYVSLPLPWEKEPRPVQIQVQARSKGGRMDWENCHLFFFLDTPKFGETGISVHVIHREVFIRIQNEREEVEEAYSPFLPALKEQLEQIGYRVSQVKFEKPPVPDAQRHSDAQPHKEKARKQSANLMKGLDLTI